MKKKFKEFDSRSWKEFLEEKKFNEVDWGQIASAPGRWMGNIAAGQLQNIGGAMQQASQMAPQLQQQAQQLRQMYQQGQQQPQQQPQGKEAVQQAVTQVMNQQNPPQNLQQLIAQLQQMAGGQQGLWSRAKQAMGRWFGGQQQPPTA